MRLDEHYPKTRSSKQMQEKLVLCLDAFLSFTYLASRSLGSKGGYRAFTTSSTLGPMRFATVTSSVRESGEHPIVMATNFSVNWWHVRKMARQWGARPLKDNEKDHITLLTCIIHVASNNISLHLDTTVQWVSPCTEQWNMWWKYEMKCAKSSTQYSAYFIQTAAQTTDDLVTLKAN